MSEEYITTTEAARELGTYRGLVRALMDHHGIEPRRIGSAHCITRKELERIRPLFEQWKNRLRLSRKPATSV